MLPASAAFRLSRHLSYATSNQSTYDSFAKVLSAIFTFAFNFRTLVRSLFHRSANRQPATMWRCGKLSEYFQLECSESSQSLLSHHRQPPTTCWVFLLWCTRIGESNLLSPITSANLFSEMSCQKLHTAFYFCSQPPRLLDSAWWPTTVKVSAHPFAKSGLWKASKHANDQTIENNISSIV